MAPAQPSEDAGSPARVITTLGGWEEAVRLLGRHYRTGDVKTVLTR